MARTRFNSKLVKIHFSFTVEEIARTVGAHKNTVRGWLKAGLEANDNRRPIMIQGQVLRTFLEDRRAANRRRCPLGTFFCLKCHAPRKPALAMVDFVPVNSSSGNVRALCETCGTLMHRGVNQAQLEALKADFEVRVVEADARLKGSSAPSLNCDSEGE